MMDKRENNDKKVPKEKSKRTVDTSISKSKKKTSAYMALIIIICIVVAVIGIINAVCIFVSLNKNTASTSDPVESSLLSTGISIIGIAVAVWAGLNIVNALERKDVEIATQKVIDLDEKTKGIENREEEQRKFDKTTLLNYMYSTEDEGTNFFIKKIQELKTTISISFLSLAELEQHFKSVYEMHRSEYSDNGNLKREAKLGIECAQELLDNPAYEDVHEYLKYRIAEFHFYSGYCTKEKERLDHYETAIKIYEELGSYFEADIPDFNASVQYCSIEFKECNANKRISAYMCNSIGESYSKIVQIKNKLISINALNETQAENYGLKAVFYCAYANHWVKKSIYKRNYACAIERHYGFSDSHYEILCDEFMQALHMDALTNSNFKNIVSIYDKHINQILQIKSISPNDLRTPSLGSSEFLELYNNLDESQKDDVLNTLEKMHKIALHAKTIHTSESVGYQYECIYYRDLFAINRKKDYL